MFPLPVFNKASRDSNLGPPASFTKRAGNQPSLLFDAMGGTIVLGRGGQAPTFTRATVATITDQDLVVRQVLSGEARFGGFRRVQNLLVSTGLTGGPSPPTGWTRSSAGGTETSANSAYFASHAAITFGIANQREIISLTVNLVAGHSYRASVFCEGITGASTFVNQSLEVIVGTATIINSVSFSSSSMLAGRRYAKDTFDCTVSGTATFRLGLGVSATETGTGTITLSAPMLEDVTGQSNQNPAEYVSVGVLSAPYQGANVDGVQYFPYLNGNTVASNVVTEARGAAISSSILGGYLPEPAATDLLNARADARDMTTANWTLGATMTRARTSTGADGVASKANRLTGGAVAATNIITTTITAAASSRTYSVLIKRVTGTGPVRITQDNFATNTDISSLINSSTYTLVQINQSQLNAVLGIKIDTNGDAIDADWNQFSAGDLTGLVNSRIPDTISTRNADVLTYATTGWLNASAGTLYVEFFNSTNTGASAISAVLNNGTANNFVRTYRSSTGGTAFADVADGGVTQSNLSVGAVATGAVQRITSVYQANDFTGFVNNTSLGTDVAGTIPALTQLDIGHQNGGSLLGHYVRKVAYYPIRMVNESAKALTA